MGIIARGSLLAHQSDGTKTGGRYSMKISRKIVALLSGVMLLAMIPVVVSFWAFSKLDRASTTRTQTSLIIDQAQSLMSELIDAETGQRGYLLTGNEAFLEPYLAVRDRVSGELEALLQLTLTSDARNDLDAITPLMAAKMAELSDTIDLYQNGDITAAVAIVNSGQGKDLMDSIRADMNSFLQIEKGLLAQNDTEFQSSMRFLFIILIFASLLTLVFALSFAFFINRETQNRLKNLVHLETQHLLNIQETTNKQLQQANITLQASEEKLAVTLNSSHHRRGNPSTLRKSSKGNPGAWHDTWLG
jgi:CHASE3 domain sensor protein